jgi:hypothetical protein
VGKDCQTMQNKVRLLKKIDRQLVVGISKNVS